ncbi:MAG: transcription-repair coupling factor [Proteobacteria bacterium]|nr:transcription-repair coupling factor [Pseudomonadota bacterium]
MGVDVMNDSFDGISDNLVNRGSELIISRVKGSERGLILNHVHKERQSLCVIVMPTRKDAEKMAQDLVFFGDKNHIPWEYFPPYNILPFKSLSYHTDTASQRLRILSLLSSDQARGFLITTPEALMQRIIPKKELVAYTDIVMINEEIDLNQLVSKFISGGYTRTTIVEEPGDFSIRGGIVDFFSPMYSNPVRIELFGDMVESLRFFSVSTQKKIDSLTEALIVPAKESIIDPSHFDEIIKRVRKQSALTGVPVSKIRHIVDRIKGEIGASEVENLLPLVYSSTDCFFNYIPDDAVFVMADLGDIQNQVDLFREKAQQNYENALHEKKLCVHPDELYLNWGDIEERLRPCRKIMFKELSVQSASEEHDKRHAVHFTIDQNTVVSAELLTRNTQENSLFPLVRWIEDKKNNALVTLIVCSTRSQAGRLKQLLAPYGLDPVVLEHLPDLARNQGQVFICIGLLSSGFVWPGKQLAVITEDEIFGVKRRITRSPSSRLKGKELFTFSELKEGDSVVHSDHGIGRYVGLEKICLNGVTNDFLHIVYRDDDKLYLPVERMGIIQKYIGVEGFQPVLDKMGNKSWDKVKEKAKKEVEKMAGELLKLYAERKVRKGFAFSAADSYFKDFETGFEYEETPGQIEAIDEVINDMEDTKPMDRLVCGDVGYGKTEVALRAAFKAVNDGRQVAVLVPTTILAEQHLKSFSDRFQRYPVRVESLSRFKSRSKQIEIIKALAQGNVDVVIGTHRLLSEDIAFKDLGLVVIDEEQRFGVKHKEKLKKIRSTVDVLTLTATPIPRTLHMSMAGIRDISIISTPPEQRQAIVTYVAEFDDMIVSEAIRKELSRKGQIFFVHNNISSIGRINDHLKSLVPEVKTAIAHGQMKESELENVMMAFVNREVDMLVCTTIIESGLDISSANTMFINRADRFGLAQLYQLRGRIGRSDEQAFAYLFIPEESTVSRDARKRMRVLMEHSDLGAGFQIAMSDLQIRGGGAALGSSQSGHIAAVGYEMFLKLMENAISDIKGEPATEELEPEINVSLSAFFPENYIPAIDQRLTIYRRLAGFKELKDLTEIKEELLDRYGDMPDEAQNILLKIMLKIMAIKAGVKRLDISGQQLIVYFSAIHQKTPHGIIDLITPEPERFELSPAGILKVKLSKGRPTMLVAQSKKILKEIAQHVNG